MDKAGMIVIEIDCENEPKILDGTLGQDRLIEFRVYGPEGSSADIFRLPLRGRWRPWVMTKRDDLRVLFVPHRTIMAGNSATLEVLEDNESEFSVRYLVTCTCGDGDWYVARGQKSPPRIIIPPVKRP